MSSQADQIKLIIDLLEQTSSLAVVGDFLKSKNLHHAAGSWAELYEKRILPPIADFSLTVDDLINLLRSVEENGRQHIFLYQCSPETAQEIMNPARIQVILKKLKIEHLLSAPLVLDQPDDPTIVDVRWESAKVPLNMTIKQVEQRRSTKAGEVTIDGNVITKKYLIVRKRAVNLFKLHHTGLLEVRIASHGGLSYKEDLLRFWNHVGDLIPGDKFTSISLRNAKAKLFSDKSTLGHKVRFSDSLLRNDNGITLRAATSEINVDLSNDRGASRSMEEFMRYDEAYCDGHNIWFKPVPGGPSREIHVLLSGLPHEFAVTVHCSQADYEYVLHELRTFNV